MTTTRSLRSTLSAFLLSAMVALAATALAGCGGGDRDEAATTPAAAPTATAGVAYEPAYPAEVSTQGLTEQDVGQQEQPHSHDDEEPHSHDEGEEQGQGDDHGHPH